MGKGTLMGEGYWEKQTRLAMEREARQHREKLERYQTVLDCYQTTREEAKKLEGYLFSSICHPYQMAIPDEYQLDFSDGIGSAIKGVKDKFVTAIVKDIAPQIRDKLTVDPFIHTNGEPKLGITIYMLSEEDMVELEDRIRESLVTAK